MSTQWMVGAVVLLATSLHGARSEPPVVREVAAFSASYERFAVAADHPLASAAGAEVLRSGGNAVDAAVATSFALSVVRPYACGIGGGGFMVIAGINVGAREANGDASTVGASGEGEGPPPRPVPLGGGVGGVCINYREMCPGAVGAEYFEKIDDLEASTRGGKSCGVPGTVAGLMYALDKYGTMERAKVLAPAIRLAREGYACDAAYLRAAKSLIERFDQKPEWKTRFAFTWTRLLASGTIAIGDIIKLPEQAAVLERIAAEGAAGFYKGEVGRTIVEAARADGGELTLEDLAGFEVVEMLPLRVKFAGRTLLMMPPPSSGGLAMAEVFGILERKNLDDVVKTENWAFYTFLLVESLKHAFADRAKFLGDPAFVDVPVARLLSKEYLDELAGRVRVGKVKHSELYGTMGQLPEDGGTSHLSVIDGKGGAVACTETINLGFGSLVATEKLGFCLNDQMDDFTTRRGGVNAFGLQQSDKNLPAPRKRPLSSMSPTIVMDKQGRVEAVAGGSGGPRIITATVQVLLNALVRGDSAARAVSRPRIHHQWKPYLLEIETGFDEKHEGMGVDMWMRKMGNTVKEVTAGAAVQVIVRNSSGGWDAACDPRVGGKPDGQ